MMSMAHAVVLPLVSVGGVYRLGNKLVGGKCNVLPYGTGISIVCAFRYASSFYFLTFVDTIC